MSMFKHLSYLHKVKIIYLELPYQDNNVEAFLDTE